MFEQFDIKLVNNDSQLSLSTAYNGSNEAKKLEECILVNFEISDDDNTLYILPGGITNKSTAADVLDVFGDPYKTTDFRYGYNDEDSLVYEDHNSSYISYSFKFNEDGTIRATQIDFEGSCLI